ncbi:MAG: GTPase ObgE [Planctomycetes bacterium]|nr:GTPase ObgE [Planctomycetota bacterium]
MFRDEAVMIALAGNGGPGCSAFHREKYITHGGPSGGDGGDGGDVVLVADSNENSLYKISRDYHARATNGQPGGNNNCSGSNGETIEVLVPVGTQVFDFERNNCLADLTEEGQRLVVAAGGKGGRGNARFATSTRQAPTYTEKGTNGEERKLRLELKLVADVGLLGLPNAGKSTLMNCVTSARARVADYPFTTLDPSLGIIDMQDFGQPIVIADIPGIIAGAAEGKGLGVQFLRHVERTKILLHLVDCSEFATDEPLEAYNTIRAEITAHSSALAERPTVVVATKIENDAAQSKASEFFAAIGHPEFCISAVKGEGLPQLKLKLQEMRTAGQVDDSRG